MPISIAVLGAGRRSWPGCRQALRPRGLLIFYTMPALVQEFLPHMIEQGDGAIPKP
jgi:hypothetical protein